MWNSISCSDHTPDTRTIEEVYTPSRLRQVRRQVQIRSWGPKSKTLLRRWAHITHEDRSTNTARDNGTGSEGGPDPETSASSNATAKSACEDDCAEPASPAKLGAQKHLSKLSGGRRYSKKISPPPTEIFLSARARKSWRPRIRWSHRGRAQSSRGQNLTSPCLSQSQGSDKARADPERPFWPQPPRR